MTRRHLLGVLPVLWLVAGWGDRPPRMPAIPEPWWGVTVDSVERLDEVEEALTGFSRTLTARVVFDNGVKAAEYRSSLLRLSRRAWIMGELMDSYDFKGCDQGCFERRTRDYWAGLNDLVSVWEIGNEVNGEWCGDTAEVVAKIGYAAAYVKARGGRTALTLFYNQDCWEDAAHEMFAWTEVNVSPRLRSRVDVVLVSYYEEECNALRPDWNLAFRRLAALFPGAKLGFGEVGARHGDKAAYLRRYYGLHVDVPGFIGGYFWWFFTQDMVPKDKPMWQVLHDAVH